MLVKGLCLILDVRNNIWFAVECYFDLTQFDAMQENLMLKEQIQLLLQENGILKRAVSIQHERQKEYEAKSQEVQQLKQLLSQCQEHIRTLEVRL